MFRLAFFLLASSPAAGARLFIPSATLAPHSDSVFPAEGTKALDHAVISPAANQAKGEGEQAKKVDPSFTVPDLPDYGKQTKRILYIVPNFNAISAGAHLPPQTAHDKFLDAAQDTFDDSNWWDLAPHPVASETGRCARHEVILLASADNRRAFRVPATGRASVWRRKGPFLRELGVVPLVPVLYRIGSTV
jgi:hypothetical protein